MILAYFLKLQSFISVSLNALARDNSDFQGVNMTEKLEIKVVHQKENKKRPIELSYK